MEKELPLREIRERLIYRQEPQTILEDLKKRGYVTEEQTPDVLQYIKHMKFEIENTRIDQSRDGC